MLLSNKVSIITGGVSGIGKSIALKFAEESSSVVIADINEQKAVRTVDEINQRGAKGIFIKCDHTDNRQVQAMIEEVVENFEKVDILVNNAGGFGLPVPITELTEDAWDTCLALNLKGVFLCCKSIAPLMIEKKYGKIVNISSIAAISAGPPNAHYTASKGGVLSLTMDLALEFARFNICVNAIVPGTIRTDMWKDYIPTGMDTYDYFKDTLISNIPLQRVGTPEDVAGAALFLASDLSSYVTGDRIIVGGGLPLQAPPF